MIKLEKIKITSSLKEIFDRAGVPKGILDYYEVDSAKEPVIEGFHEIKTDKENPFREG